MSTSTIEEVRQVVARAVDKWEKKEEEARKKTLDPWYDDERKAKIDVNGLLVAMGGFYHHRAKMEQANEKFIQNLRDIGISL